MNRVSGTNTPENLVNFLHKVNDQRERVNTSVRKHRLVGSIVALCSTLHECYVAYQGLVHTSQNSQNRCWLFLIAQGARHTSFGLQAKKQLTLFAIIFKLRLKRHKHFAKLL